MRDQLYQFLVNHPQCQRIAMEEADKKDMVRCIVEEFMVGYLSTLIREIEEIMGIDQNLEQKKILEIAAERIVKDLQAEAASIRLFDPETKRMTSFGAYRFAEQERVSSIPFKDTIAGKVVRELRSIPVSSILNCPEYSNKEVVRKKGVRSLLAVPIRIPKFMESEKDLLGSLQIYYKEEGRRFDPLEIIHAELLARRVSYVLMKKKIMDLQKLNTRKEKIVNKIFVKLSNREGVKIKDLFVLLIPELGEFLQVQSCSLFTVSKDHQFVRLEAAYPLDQTYHDPGSTFTVRHHPYFETVIHGAEAYGDYPFERIDPAYLLIKDPKQSRLAGSPGMCEFVEKFQVHSILIIPLKADASIRYLMMFYATDQRQYFTDEEVELLTFFGREIMKASRLELLDDVLHDFKNPAIAISGFAARALKLLDAEDLEKSRDKLASYLDIIMRETTRLQDLSFAMSVEGREEPVELSEVVRKRLKINQEAMHASGRGNIRLLPSELAPGLMVYCSLFGLERVLDNILNNATRAIPEEGGILSARTYADAEMACLEIRNTGEIPQEKIEQIRSGEVKGRGLNIIYRFVQANHGSIAFSIESGETICTVKIPMHRV